MWRLGCRPYSPASYMHTPDPAKPLEESVQAFHDLIEAGKVCYWGFSTSPVRTVRGFLQTCDENGWHRLVVNQPPYSLLKREVERDLLLLCKDQQLGVVPTKCCRVSC